jgi:hypothetical protein
MQISLYHASITQSYLKYIYFPVCNDQNQTRIKYICTCLRKPLYYAYTGWCCTAGTYVDKLLICSCRYGSSNKIYEWTEVHWLSEASVKAHISVTGVLLQYISKLHFHTEVNNLWAESHSWYIYGGLLCDTILHIVLILLTS